MTTEQIAQRLAELINQGEYEKAHQELYSPHIVSIENPAQENEYMKYKKDTGIETITAKAKQWSDSFEEFYGQGAGEPIIADNTFALSLWFEGKLKNGNRIRNEEIAVYRVQDNKIVMEEFFY